MHRGRGSGGRNGDAAASIVKRAALWVNVINCSLPNLQRATRVPARKDRFPRSKTALLRAPPDEGESSVSFSEMCQQNMNNKRQRESKANCKSTACVMGWRHPPGAGAVFWVNALRANHSFWASQDQFYAKNSLLSTPKFSQPTGFVKSSFPTVWVTEVVLESHRV